MFNLFRNKKPIQAEKIHFSYSEKEVLRDISLNLRKGEIICVVGKSGSGKSTFLKILAGIISIGYKGKIKIFGKPSFFEKRKIGFVPQEISLIPDLSIEDNIKVIGLSYGVSEKISLERADELFKLLKIEESIKKKPLELSGGQRSRLNIVLSILHNPDILIMDEPFVGLDFENRKLVWHFLESLRRKGKSIILTSHLLSEVEEHADRLVILKSGKIFFSGGLEKLREKLKINFILELRFQKFSKEKFENLRKFCVYKDIKLMDFYENYAMFGMNSEKERDIIFSFLNKLGINFKEKTFREPNLDEIFLSSR
ncbi:MAG: ABC transporter ATP-binding protein [Candidatus Pacearchaeota archaeon]